MQRLLMVMMILGFTIFSGALPDHEDKIWQKVLSSVALERADLGISPLEADFFGGGKYRLHFFEYLWQRPLATPDILGPFVGVLQDHKTSAGWLAMQGVYPLGISARRNLIGSPADEWKKKGAESGALMTALLEVTEASGGKFSQRDRRRAEQALRSLPPDLHGAIATLLFGIADSLRWRRYALRDLPEPDRDRFARNLLSYISSREETDPKEMRWVEETLERVDLSDLYVGGIDLGFAVDAFIEARLKPETFPASAVRIDTPAGVISIGGAGDDRYNADKRWLLIIDPSGNDRYEGAGFAEGDHRALSVIFDFGGNDVYGAGNKTGPNAGGAVLGYAIVTDFSGDDLYEGGTLGAGAAAVGLAVVHDFSGNDRYNGYIVGQGAGHFGVGVLADLAGNDRYYLYQQGQGYGFTLGSGLLLDIAGNDHYIADDKDIRFPSPQTKEHNVSLAQGAGYGKRADYIDQHSLSGGVGLLVDLEGNDSYECGVFGQGVGYWYGLGGLVDLAGDDSYQGIWYVQGASAHFAVGLLWEGGGDDRYYARMNMAQGAGHDFSVGYLLDEHGDDIHESPNLSLGGGNANGIGIFWDRAGSDVYASTPGIVLGKSSVAATKSIREHLRTIGIFLDTGGGDDIYVTVTTEKEGETEREVRSPHPAASNNALWQQPGAQNNPLEIGVGIDE